MNSQIQTQLITLIFVLFFAFSLSPISLALHISAVFNIHLFMFSSSTVKSTLSSLPCTYMDKSSTFLKKLVSSKPSKANTITPTSSKHIPITIPAKLTQAQKEAALPFLTQEPPKPKSSTSSKAKALSRFFKKLAKVPTAKDCLKSSSTTDEKKKKIQYKLTFIPISKKKEDPISSSKTEATEIVWYDSEISSTISTAPETTADNSSAVEFAQRIWDEDQTVYNKNLDQVVEWIGNGQASSTSILQSYMSHFDFKDLKLEQAFRNLCSKLYLKGETQQIDRILLQFSARYVECNPQCIFGTTDVVHAIVYSLLLLNTDLHVAQGDYKKMTQSAFIKNTINAIAAQSPAASSNLSTQSFDCVNLHRTPSNKSSLSSRSYGAQSLDSSMPCNNLSSCTFGSKSWQIEIKNLLKQMYSNIRHSQITDPSTTPTSTRQQQNRMSTAFKLSVGTWRSNTRDDHVEETTSIASGQSYAASSIMQYQAVASHLQNTDLPTCYISNAPYYKEGMVIRKHLLEDKDQKAKHRDWKDCFMVIERSQLRMYKLDTTSCWKRSRSRTFSDSASQVSSVVGGGDWMSNAQLIGSIDLKHTLANALPSGYSSQREYAFTLEQSNGGVFVFQAGSAEQVNEWVSTCNYWAARESKEPLVGGISSMEYGWGICLDNNTDVMVHEWQAPACPTISSMLEESAQLEVFHKHVQELVFQLDCHRDIQPKMELHFISAKFGVRAMNNWEHKSHYLLREIIKYQNYCNSIEKSLDLQANLSASY